MVDEMGCINSYKILETFEFTSERKCMSIILKNQMEQIYLFCKVIHRLLDLFMLYFMQGADSVMMEKMKKNEFQMQNLLKQVTIYAEAGLRLLVHGYKEINTKEYNAWKVKFVDASSSIENRDHQVAQLVSEIEQNLILLGLTCVEDKLQVMNGITVAFTDDINQDDVDTTICKLKEAGILTWMATWMETAVNIAKNCKYLLHTV